MSLLISSIPAWGDFAPEEWRGRNAYIVGTIRDVSGLPLAHVKVIGSGTEWSPDGRSGVLKTFETYTDSLGAYRLDLPAGAEGAWAEHPAGAGFPGPELLMSSPISPGEHRVDLQFQLFHVHGILLGGDSLPAPRGLVVYYATPPKGSVICGTGLPEAPVAKGSFELTVQHPVRVSFCASLSDRPFGAPNVYREIQINGDTLITLRVGGIPVAGSVHGYRGQPLANASIEVSGTDFVGEVRSDRDGNFRASVTPGSYRWRIQPANREHQRWTTVDSAKITHASRIALALDTVRWNGRVLDRRSGQGLDSIRIYADDNIDRRWETGADCLSGPNGEFQLFVRRGAVFDLSLFDERGPRVAVPVSMRIDEIERKYRRVSHRTVTRVHSMIDSTFEIVMEPVRR